MYRRRFDNVDQISARLFWIEASIILLGNGDIADLADILSNKAKRTLAGMAFSEIKI